MTLSALAEHYGEHATLGGRAAVSLSGEDWFRTDVAAIERSNREIQVAPADDIAMESWARSSHGKPLIPRPSQIVIWAGDGGVSGFIEGEGGETRCLLGGGNPLQLHYSHIWACPHKWQVQHPGVFLPFKSHRDCPVVPLVGDIHVNGQELTSEQMGELGLQPLGCATPGDAATAMYVRYPIFLLGGRSAFVPGTAILSVLDTPEGGIEIVDPHAATKIIRGIGVQLTGVGCRRHTYRSIEVEKVGDHDLPLQLSFELPDGLALAQDLRYRGKQDLMLDLQQQVINSACCGGLTTAQISLERDLLLLRHGVVMSSITVDFAPLIKKAELEAVLGNPTNMTSSSTEVSVKVITDTTIRVSDLLSPDFSDEALVTFIGSNGEAEDFRLKSRSHFERFCSTVGTNVERLLAIGYYFADTDSVRGNTSGFGGFADSENLIPMTDLTASGSLLRQYCRMAAKVGNRLGIPDEEILQMIAEHVGARIVGRSEVELLEAVSPSKEKFGLENLLLHFGALIAKNWVQQQIRVRQVPVSVQELVRETQSIPIVTSAVEDAFGLAPQSIQSMEPNSLPRDPD